MDNIINSTKKDKKNFYSSEKINSISEKNMELKFNLARAALFLECNRLQIENHSNFLIEILNINMSKITSDSSIAKKLNFYINNDFVNTLEEKQILKFINSVKKSILMIAIQKGNVKLINKLIPYEYMKVTLNGGTALMLAAGLGDVSSVKKLIPYNSTKQMNNGTTALMSSVYNNKVNSANLLAKSECGIKIIMAKQLL